MQSYHGSFPSISNINVQLDWDLDCLWAISFRWYSFPEKSFRTDVWQNAWSSSTSLPSVSGITKVSKICKLCTYSWGNGSPGLFPDMQTHIMSGQVHSFLPVVMPVPRVTGMAPHKSSSIISLANLSVNITLHQSSTVHHCFSLHPVALFSSV